MGVAERQADIIVVATLERGSPESLTRIGAQLRVVRVLKGTAPPPLIAVELVPPSMMTTHARSLQDHVPGRLIGSAGIWFIKEGADATFRLIPLATGDFVWEEVFLRLQKAELPEPAAVLPDLAEFDNSARRFILAALVDSYMSSADPFTLRDLVVVSLNDPENRQDSLAAAKALVASGSPDHQILGLGAALRLGSDEALQWLAEKAPALQSHPMYASLVFALSTEYKPNGEASIVPLRQLVTARGRGQLRCVGSRGAPENRHQGGRARPCGTAGQPG